MLAIGTLARVDNSPIPNPRIIVNSGHTKSSCISSYLRCHPMASHVSTRFKMRFWKTGLVVGACAACCAAPLLLGSAMAAIGVAGLSFAEWGERWVAASLVGAGVLWLMWRRIRPFRRGAGSTGCGCGPNTCGPTGESCDVPISKNRSDASPNRPLAS